MKRSENILDKVDSFEILNRYLKPYHNFNTLQKGKNISNPFLSTKQKTPSFNIYQPKTSSHWKFKDFATGDSGNCFELVMRLYSLDFKEALDRIESDFNIKNHSTMSSNKYNQNEFSIIHAQFSQQSLAFWNQYQITEQTLRKYNVQEVKEYTAISKFDKPYTIKGTPHSPIFSYSEVGWTKIYRPFEKNYKFQHLGNKPSDFIFGLKQLPQQDDMLFITGGEKDVITLASQNFNAIALNSETATLNLIVAKELRQRFNNVIVLYDIDDTGLKQSEILSEAHGFHRMILSRMPNNGKDISDFFKEGKTNSEFQEILIETLSHPAPPIPELELQVETIEEVEKVVYSALELMSMGSVEPKYLMNPIFPQKGSAVLAGKPDTGKSQFARQLCIEVALGNPTFLGFDLKPRHNKSIYVATEDNLEATQYLLSKQLSGLAATAKENLKFIFADTMEQDEILKNLNDELTKNPADLVVVDSFGDIFTGRDSNNNIAMRNTVKTFDSVAKKHNCLILFVHHINKGAYRQAPGQEHIQGGAGLVQKVRLAIQLTEGEQNIRYFTVVKGNYCPKEYKQNSLELNFSEQTFLFTNTGKMIPTDQLGSKDDTIKKEEKYNDLLNIAQNIFSHQSTLSYGNLVKHFCDVSDKSAPTAKRTIKLMLELDILLKSNGVYALNPSASSNLNTETDEDDLEF
jgi:KaiC/GvpD/RAD55 family RecA-like ATPase